MPLRFEVRPAVRGALTGAELARLRTRARRMLAAVALADRSLGSPAKIEAGLTLTDDDEIHELNRTWRKKDKPTDVLAFAMREGEGGSLHPEQLGDVVISVQTAKRQAKAIRKQTLFDEVVFLWSHGLCHLLGYDHRNDREERQMNERMASLRAEADRRGKVRPA